MDGYYDPYPSFYLDTSIMLVGHPGSGVARVGHELAARTGLPHTEVERWCEADAGMSRARLLVEAGLPELRRVETRALERSVARQPHGFISVGSGCLEPARIRGHVLERCCVVFVKRESGFLLERIRRARARAPGSLAEFALAAPESVEALERWLEDRREIEAAAHVILAGEARHPNRLADDLLHSLGRLAGKEPLGSRVTP